MALAGPGGHRPAQFGSRALVPAPHACRTRRWTAWWPACARLRQHVRARQVLRHRGRHRRGLRAPRTTWASSASSSSSGRHRRLGVTRVFVQQKIKPAVLKCLGARSSQLLAIYWRRSSSSASPAACWASASPRWRWRPSPDAGRLGDAGRGGELRADGGGGGPGAGHPGCSCRSSSPRAPARRPSRQAVTLLRDDTTAHGGIDLRRRRSSAGGRGLVALTVTAGRIVARRTGGGHRARRHGRRTHAGLLLIRHPPAGRAPWFPLRRRPQLSRPGSGSDRPARGQPRQLLHPRRPLAPENLVAEFAVDLSSRRRTCSDRHPAVGSSASGADRRDRTPMPPPRLVPTTPCPGHRRRRRDLQLENYEDVRGGGRWPAYHHYRAGLEENERSSTARSGRPPAGTMAGLDRGEHPRPLRHQVGDMMRFDILGRGQPGSPACATSVGRQPGGRVHVRLPSRRARAGAAARLPSSAGRRPRSTAAACRPTGGRGAQRLGDRRSRDPADHPHVVDNVTLAVTVVGSLVVLSGLLILVGAVAMTKFGASTSRDLQDARGDAAPHRHHPAASAGCWAPSRADWIGRGHRLTWDQPLRARDPFRPLPGLTVAGVVLTAVVVAMVGVGASWDVLRRKPLATLRGVGAPSRQGPW